MRCFQRNCLCNGSSTYCILLIFTLTTLVLLTTLVGMHFALYGHWKNSGAACHPFFLLDAINNEADLPPLPPSVLVLKRWCLVFLACSEHWRMQWATVRWGSRPQTVSVYGICSSPRRADPCIDIHGQCAVWAVRCRWSGWLWGSSDLGNI